MHHRLVCLLLIVMGNLSNVSAAPAESEQGMVASVHPLATRAGLAALRNGGNAVDAAVATALTLGVVDGHNSGIGGGCFILIRRPDGMFTAIDGRETAPARAHRDMYLVDGQAHGELSTIGPLAVATPGAIAAYSRALRQHGRLKLADLLLPAADIAEHGFRLDRVFAGNLQAQAQVLARFDGSRQALLKPDGSPYREGELLRLPDLAATYRALAVHGIDWFYRGEFASRVGQWMADHGGILSAQDFANYVPVDRQPLVTKYRDCQVVGFPPPSSGGVHVAQILNILEHFDLTALHSQDPAAFVHVVAEAMKLAFADRAHWLGDPAFAQVPKGLIDPAYAAELARRIDRERATPVSRHGDPPRADADYFRGHTTHIAAADAEGWWVAITATVNTSFGSKVIVPGTGVVLNNEMDDFSIQPSVPNAFGLVGAEANAIAPGKRPLSSMSPTILLRDGRPFLTVGAAGGPTIISQVVLAIVNHLDRGWPLDQAVAAPRFHHQWSPNALTIEPRLPAEVQRALAGRGHELRERDSMGVTQALTLTGTPLRFLGVHDPRVPGLAAGPTLTPAR
ncbi:MAG: gamma-glutamyltransferase [Pirellulaceae bacterium]